MGTVPKGNDEGTGFTGNGRKYEVDESVAADDLDRFLQQLRNAENIGRNK